MVESVAGKRADRSVAQPEGKATKHDPTGTVVADTETQGESEKGEEQSPKVVKLATSRLNKNTSDVVDVKVTLNKESIVGSGAFGIIRVCVSEAEVVIRANILSRELLRPIGNVGRKWISRQSSIRSRVRETMERIGLIKRAIGNLQFSRLLKKIQTLIL